MVDTAVKAKGDTKYARNIIIAAIIYVLFQFLLPVSEPLTRGGMGVVGIFIAALWLWSTIGIGWPSMLCIGMFATTGVCKVTDLLAKTWGNVMVPFVIAAFMLNFAMGEVGLTRRIAMWFITRPSCKGKPYRIMFMFFLSIALLAAVSTASPICVLYMAIAEEIFAVTGYKKGDPLTQYTMIAIFWMAQTMMLTTPISHPLVPMITEYILKDFGINVSMLQFCSIFIVVGVFFFIGNWIMFRYIVKPDVSGLTKLDIDAMRASMPKMSKEERIVAIVYGLLIVFWLCPDLISAIGLKAVGSWMSNLGQGIPAMIAIAVLCIFRVNGKPIADFNKLGSKVPMGSVAMMATVMGTAYIFGLDTVGINAWLTAKAAPLLGHVPAWVFVLAATTWILVQTSFMSNTLTASMYLVIMPIAITVAGVNPIAIGLMIASACNAPIATPSGSPAAGFASGQGWTPVAKQAKWGWPLVAYLIAVYCLIGYPLSCMLFPH